MYIDLYIPNMNITCEFACVCIGVGVCVHLVALALGKHDRKGVVVVRAVVILLREREK